MRVFRGARANMAMGARRVLGGAKHAIKFLGRANNFAKGLGITNPWAILKNTAYQQQIFWNPNYQHNK